MQDRERQGVRECRDGAFAYDESEIDEEGKPKRPGCVWGLLKSKAGDPD